MAERTVDLGTVVLGSVTGFMKDAMEKKTPVSLALWQDLSKKITEAVEKAGFGKGEAPIIRSEDDTLFYKGINYVKASISLKQHLEAKEAAKPEKTIPLRNIKLILQAAKACGGLENLAEMLK